MPSPDNLSGTRGDVIVDRALDWIAGPVSGPEAFPFTLSAVGRRRQQPRFKSGSDTPRPTEGGRRASESLVGITGLVAIGRQRTAAPPIIHRQSIAILAADIVGYSRLIELDDLNTALRVRHLRRHLIEPTTLAHRGRIVDLAGDGTLMAFAGSAQAVECAVEIQRGLKALEQNTPADQQIQLRIGISFDDILVIDGDLYGRAVNVAARLEALAEPGDVYLSDAVFDRVGGSIAVRCEPLGERKLRNIAKSVQVYRVARSELA